MFPWGQREIGEACSFSVCSSPSWAGDFPGELQAALKRLRENDGSELRPATEKFNERLKGRSRVNSDA
ncbi:hypothetical protein N182_05280 [Sinorhizobium sp. GL2]|nr:hypothetical protein N182_05280 [Sinorhizobium sp. GL2]